jgi:hypothetical protein
MKAFSGSDQVAFQFHVLDFNQILIIVSSLLGIRRSVSRGVTALQLPL